MTAATTSAFNLSDRLTAKADPALIAADDQHLRAVSIRLEEAIAELYAHLAAGRRAPGRSGQAALERDQEIHRTSARLRTLRRFDLDVCLGRMVSAGSGETFYIGRVGLTDHDGRQLLIDWRSPAAEAFFGATHANPMGLVSRRRYRWTRGQISDYWDEVFTAEGLQSNAALDDQSAFIASLGASRSPLMRDVLSTIQADQDAVIRASSLGAFVVDGGPGTGKTVVALHRAAYLLYSDPHLGHHRGGVLFIGPHQPYLAYVADVLPHLGEEGVLTATMRDLVPEGASAFAESDPEVELLKSSAQMAGVIEPAVGLYENPPTETFLVETDWFETEVGPAEWADAFEAADPGVPHNEARDQIWEELLDILIAKADDDLPADLLHRSLRRHAGLADVLNRAWPLIDAADLVGDLWTVPAYLRMCAPWLSRDDVRRLQRTDPQAWTVADLPLLDAARLRLGDPQASRRRRRREANAEAERERMADVISDLIETDDSEMAVMSMLRGADLQNALETEADGGNLDVLAGPFAHIIVDEAQELTDAQWQMLLRRCPSRSVTVVGDRAQSRRGFAESWSERLERVGFSQVTVASLSINYRTPIEVMAEAEPVIRAAIPDANVPRAVRSTGLPVLRAAFTERDNILERWLAEHEGIACVIGDPTCEPRDRVQSLSAEEAKGLEFDLVVLVEGVDPGTTITDTVDRYVAMTRATQQLAILTRAVTAQGRSSASAYSPT